LRLNDSREELAEAKPVKQTIMDAKVEWRSKFTTKTLKSKTIRIEFELRKSKLYSLLTQHVISSLRTQKQGLAVSVSVWPVPDGWPRARGGRYRYLNRLGVLLLLVLSCWKDMRH